MALFEVSCGSRCHLRGCHRSDWSLSVERAANQRKDAAYAVNCDISSTLLVMVVWYVLSLAVAAALSGLHARSRWALYVWSVCWYAL